MHSANGTDAHIPTMPNSGAKMDTNSMLSTQPLARQTIRDNCGSSMD